jgi:hypothetical protein
MVSRDSTTGFREPQTPSFEKNICEITERWQRF